MVGSTFHCDPELGFPPNKPLPHPIFWDISTGLKVERSSSAGRVLGFSGLEWMWWQVGKERGKGSE